MKKNKRIVSIIGSIMVIAILAPNVALANVHTVRHNATANMAVSLSADMTITGGMNFASATTSISTNMQVPANSLESLVAIVRVSTNGIQQQVASRQLRNGSATTRHIFDTQTSSVRTGERVFANGWSRFINPTTGGTTLVGGSNISTNQVNVRTLPPLPEGFQLSECGNFTHPIGRDDLIFVATYDEGLDGWAYATELQTGSPISHMTQEEINLLSEEEIEELHSQDIFIDVYGDDFTTVIGRFQVFSADDWKRSQMTDEDRLLELAEAGMRMPRNAEHEDIITSYTLMRLYQMESALLYEQTGKHLDWKVIMQMHKDGATWDDILAEVGVVIEND